MRMPRPAHAIQAVLINPQHFRQRVKPPFLLRCLVHQYALQIPDVILLRIYRYPVLFFWHPTPFHHVSGRILSGRPSPAFYTRHLLLSYHLSVVVPSQKAICLQDFFHFMAQIFSFRGCQAFAQCFIIKILDFLSL